MWSCHCDVWAVTGADPCLFILLTNDAGAGKGTTIPARVHTVFSRLLTVVASVRSVLAELLWCMPCPLVSVLLFLLLFFIWLQCVRVYVCMYTCRLVLFFHSYTCGMGKQFLLKPVVARVRFFQVCPAAPDCPLDPVPPPVQTPTRPCGCVWGPRRRGPSSEPSPLSASTTTAHGFSAGLPKDRYGLLAHWPIRGKHCTGEQ